MAKRPAPEISQTAQEFLTGYRQLPPNEVAKLLANSPEHLRFASRRPVFVAFDRRVAPSLNETQKADILARCGEHLKNLDWPAVDSAREVYARRRYEILYGVDHKDLRRAADKIFKTCQRLMVLFDLPQKRQGAGARHFPNRDALLLAWERIEKVKDPSLNTRDDIYPIITQIAHRASLVRRAAKNPGKAAKQPWQPFVSQLFAIHAGTAGRSTRTRPKGGERDKDLRLSPFQKFVAAVCDTLPEEVREHNQGASAFMNAVADAVEGKK